jgi:hypothetical protein
MSYPCAAILLTTPSQLIAAGSRPGLRGEDDVLDEVKTWWQNVPPEVHGWLVDGGVALGALVVGHFLGVWVVSTLRGWNFDAALRPPPATPATGESERRFGPTVALGLLVRLTVWAGAGWWLAQKYGQADLAATLAFAIRRTWALATTLVAALGLGSLLARRLFDCLQHMPKQAPETAAPRIGGVAPPVQAAGVANRGVAGAVSAGAYVLAVLVVLLIAADTFDWPLTRGAAQGLWQFTQHGLAAGAALLIGLLGARWARNLAVAEGAGAAEKRAANLLALGLVGGSTVLAVAVVLSGTGMLIGLAVLALLGLLIWLARGYVPDVLAGWQLRGHKSAEVWFEGATWHVVEVGFLTTQLGRAGAFCQAQNRQVLESLLRGTPAEAAAR